MTSGRTSEAATNTAEELRQVAHRIGNLRTMRAKVFGNDVSSEAACDMLLALFADDGRSPSHSVSSLCAAAGISLPEALAVICHLERKGLVAKRDNFAARQTTLVQLTDNARDKVGAFCAALISIGL